MGSSSSLGIGSLLQGTGVAIAVIFGWLMVYVFEGARLGILGVPFTVVSVSSATLIRCLVSLIALFFLLGWSLIPWLLVFQWLDVLPPLRHVLTVILVTLVVLAFTGIMVRFFAYGFMAGGATLTIVLVANAMRRRWRRRGAQISSDSEIVGGDEDRIERAFAFAGIVFRGAAILLLAAFVAGRDEALHQVFYLVRQGDDATVKACIADQVDKFLCINSLGSSRPIFSFVSKTAATSQGFTVERVGPSVRPFGIWDTPRGRPAWNWARVELQQE